MSEDLGHALGELTTGRADRTSLERASRLLIASARNAGTAAVASGRWIAELLVDTAPRIPIRDERTLVVQHDGLTGDALAAELVQRAGRAAAAIGAAAGALVSAEELAPPAWVAIPLELVVETLAVAAIEVKLVAELHAVFAVPVGGPPGERATALVRAWAERRGVTVGTLTRPRGVADALGRSTRNEVIRIVRRRLMRRMGRSLSSLAPLFIGAVAGAELNRRGTRALGEAVIRDLRRH